MILLQKEILKGLVQQRNLKKNLAAKNKYIPKHIPDNLRWYERDGLLTYIDKLKCDRVLEDPDKHFKETKIINFEIIHQQARNEKIFDKKFNKNQTITKERTRLYPKKEQNKFLSSAFRTNREDIYKECEKLNELYLKNNIAYYGFDLFFVKIICCIKCSYDSVFFKSQTGYKKWKIYHQQKYTII